MTAGEPTVVVVGATATGKTALAIELARQVDGEIINADSRQVYRGMDVGTAKPTAEQQRAVRHWVIDVADPREPFSIAQFIDLAKSAIDDIYGRGKTAILAGGTGQYVWALVEGWRVPRVAPDAALRAELEALASREGTGALLDELRASDPLSADRIDPMNARRLIRAIEVTRTTGTPFSAQRGTAGGTTPPVVGLRMERAALYERIDARVDGMMSDGFVDEVRRLVADGCTCALPAMSGIGYRQICDFLAGDYSVEEAVARIKTGTHRLARMQRTWFRPDDARIAWLDAESPQLVKEALDALRRR